MLVIVIILAIFFLICVLAALDPDNRKSNHPNDDEYFGI